MQEDAAMRRAHACLALLSALSVALLASAVGCTATGSTTVVASGNEGGTGLPGFDPASDDGGTTTSDAGSDPQVDDYDALFGPPSVTTTTPDSLRGLWAGTSSSGYDMRIRFGTSSIVLALRCGSAAAIGVSVAASVSSSTVKTLESKRTGATSCSISVTPDEIQSCTSAEPYDCFTLKGTKVELSNFLGTSGSFTKLSD